MTSFKNIIKGEVKQNVCKAPQKYTKRKFKKNRKSKRRKAGSHVDPIQHQMSENPMQCTWFWENYNNSMNWIGRHEVAYWKSRALALERENDLLHNYIQSMHEQGYENFSQQDWTSVDEFMTSKIEPENNFGVKCEDNNSVIESVSDDLEFEVTEDMLKFLEKSIRHKMLLRKQQQDESKDTVEDEEGSNNDQLLPPRVQVGVKRAQEMQLLYGKASPMITGMETAMQLSFERNCDRRQPKLWPNIALKL